MSHVFVYKAQGRGVGTEDIPDLTITATKVLPDFASLDEARLEYMAQGRAIVHALRSSLPGGTVDQILLALLEARASLLSIPALDPAPRSPRSHADRVHELKTHLKPFDDVVARRKTFEFRKNDRDYRIGDVLVLKRYDPDVDYLSGEQCRVIVSYILEGGAYGVPHGYCVLGIVHE